MTKALILGVNGQDGSYLAELLLSKGYAVIGWIPSTIPVSLEHIQPILSQITLVKGNLLDQDSLTACVAEFLPDEAYNFISPSSPSESWNYAVQTGDIAGLGVARLLEAIRRAHPKAHFFQASSSEIFGDPYETPQRETTPFGSPRNPYGVAKLYAHCITRNYREHFDLSAACGIMYNHESPRRGLEFVTRKITRTAAQIKLGLEHELHLGNLEARRDWGFAGDYVEAMWKMMQQNEPDDFVIGTGETHSVLEFCELAFGYLGLDYRDYVVQDPNFYRPAESQQLVADRRKAREKLGWEPKTSFERLIQIMIEADLKVVR